jgi:hypothetical protein
MGTACERHCGSNEALHSFTIDAARKKFGRNTVPAWGLYSELYKAR